MALFRGIQEYIALDVNNITLVFDSGNIVNISGNIFLYPPQGHPILYNSAKCSRKAFISIVHFKRRVFHDSFNQYVFFFSKHCTIIPQNKCNIHLFMNIEMSMELYNGGKHVAQPSVVMTQIRPMGYQY